MLIDSALVTRGSGSIGGMTMSHGRGGFYLRARTIPTDPNTAFQQAVRASTASLSTRWVDTLTQAQRDKWSVYATNVAMTNPLGATIYLTGLNHYVRSNVPRDQAGLPRVDDAPILFTLGSFTPVVAVISEALQQAAIVFEATDDWVGEDDAGLVIGLSRPQNQTINYFKGPYRFADSVDGDGTTPPTSPTNISIPFAAVVGQQVFFTARVTRADGRLSSIQRGVQTVVS